MVFVFVAAAAALRGSNVGILAFLGLALLMPRPLMVPIAAWILWKQPEWRLPTVGLTAAYAALLVATGQAQAWMQVLLGVGGAVAQTSRDIGPGALLGGWWTWIGLGLAIGLTLRGRLGFASLAASPYWLPQYLLMALLELRPRAKKLPWRQVVDAKGGAEPRLRTVADAKTDESETHADHVPR